MNDQKAPQEEPTGGELVEGRDYYIENGYWVFTAAYLRARGYCCGSGCRHCPYSGSATQEK